MISQLRTQNKALALNQHALHNTAYVVMQVQQLKHLPYPDPATHNKPQWVSECVVQVI